MAQSRKKSKAEDEAPESEVRNEDAAPPKRDQPKEPAWAVREHINSAHTLHNQPGWLVQFVLQQHSPDEQLTKDEVGDLITAFLAQSETKES